MKDTRDDLRVIIFDSFQYSVEMQGYEDALHGVDKCRGIYWGHMTCIVELDLSGKASNRLWLLSPFRLLKTRTKPKELARTYMFLLYFDHCLYLFLQNIP